MVEQWYILQISGPEISSIEGPFERLPLLKKVSMSPDTLVRKGADGSWKSAWEYEELRPYLFKKKSKKKPKKASDPEVGVPALPPGDILVSQEAGGVPPSLDGWIWFFVLILLLMTTWVQLKIYFN